MTGMWNWIMVAVRCGKDTLRCGLLVRPQGVGLMGKTTWKIVTGSVRFCAWFFAVATVLTVCLVVVSSADNPNPHATIMSSGADAWGLTYIGRPGMLLALAQTVAVTWALWASRARKPALRLIGHTLLILWSALWTANAFYVFGDGTFNLIYIMPFFLLCTCLRAALDLRRRSPSESRDIAPVPEPK